MPDTLAPPAAAVGNTPDGLDEKLEMLAVRVAPSDRALLRATATLAGCSVSALLRTFIREGTRDRLRELAAPRRAP